jgi:thiol-disulfide isomerase/thioredoxin
MYIARSIVLGLVIFLGAGITQPRIGDMAPVLPVMKVLNDGSNHLLKWKDLSHRTIVLDFWATWCGPCVASIPNLNKLIQESDVDRVVFLSIDDENPSYMKDFAIRKGLRSLIVADAEGKILRLYGVYGRPSVIVISGSGRIVAITRIESLSARQLADWSDQ